MTSRSPGRGTCDTSLARVASSAALSVRASEGKAAEQPPGKPLAQAATRFRGRPLHRAWGSDLCLDGDLPCILPSPRGVDENCKNTVGCKRAVRNQDFGFHFTFRLQVFSDPRFLLYLPSKSPNKDETRAIRKPFL